MKGSASNIELISVTACSKRCTKDHDSDGDCLVCGKGWQIHRGHDCSDGRRGSWLSSNHDFSKCALFSSGNRIGFELNSFENSLSIKIDGKLAVVVSNIDSLGVRPFVCMSRNCSVSMSSSKSLVINANASLISFKDRLAGLDNNQWKEEQDIALSRISTAGIIKKNCSLMCDVHDMHFSFLNCTWFICRPCFELQKRADSKSSCRNR